MRGGDWQRCQLRAAEYLATIVDPKVLIGWGVRPHDNQYTFTVQQQVIPRVSADFSFTHRSFHGFLVTNDLNRDPATAYDTYTVTAPQDPRLPNGGGYPITIYTVKPTANVPGEDVGAADQHLSAAIRSAQFHGQLLTRTRTGRMQGEPMHVRIPVLTHRIRRPPHRASRRPGRQLADGTFLPPNLSASHDWVFPHTQRW